MDKKNILFVGDTLSGSIPTGLAGVLIEFLKRFPKENYNVAYANLAGRDVKHASELRKFGEDFFSEYKDLKLYNCQLHDKVNHLNLDKVLESYKPEIVISIHDPWMFDSIYCSKFRKKFFWVAYVTIETPDYDEFVCNPTTPMPTARKSIKKILGNADLLVPVTSIGENLFKEWGLTNYVSYIYNGLDFSNEVEKPKSKKSIFGDSVEESDFIFCTMGVNSRRKKIDLSIEAFSKFLSNIPEEDKLKYKLYLHTNANSTAGGGTDIGTMVHRLGLIKNVIFSKELSNGLYLSKKDLYKKLKVCDCYIGLPSGEGFGYGFAEAMLNKLPIIYSSYGGHTCYLDERGYPTSIKTLMNTDHAYFKWGYADTDHASELMKMIVDGNTLSQINTEDNYEFVKENFDWDHLAIRLIEDIEHKFREYLEKRDGIFDFNLKRVM